MSRPIPPSVMKREAEGIGRLYAAGYGPDSQEIQLLPGSRLPPRQPWAWPTCALEGDWMTIDELARALVVRRGTVREWLGRAGLDAPQDGAADLGELVRARRAGEISEAEYADAVDATLHMPAPGLVDCDALARWAFREGTHRLRHRWAWWWVERMLGTWTDEGGYLDAPAMTYGEWVAAWR